MRWALIAITTCLTLPGCGKQAAEPSVARAEGHPRLFIGQSDVARLRSWATSTNPMWTKGLRVVAREAKRDMDRGCVPGEDTGSDTYAEYTSEGYAELFAFLSLVAPDARAGADYGRRARKVLMAVIDEAEEGRGGDDEPFRDPDFSVSDRSRWNGEAFAFTLDWAYGYFSDSDKRRIRKVFLRWSREQFRGYPMTWIEGARPRPNGRANDPALTANPEGVRESLNNYYLAHARNLGLMAMALDPGDDPGGKLRHYLRDVTGQWLFVIDHALRTDAAGGLSPEGFQYGPEALGRVAQLLYAMRTAGEAGPSLDSNPFWADSVTAFASSLPFRPTRLTGELEYIGDVFLPAQFGSASDAWAGDPITLFAPLALDAAARGDQQTVDAIRWIQTHMAPGGAAGLPERIDNVDQPFSTLLYFMLFEPGAPAPADPRGELPTRFFAPGLNRTVARTCWCDDERIFAHKLSWNAIDHQIADGNDFAFGRKGEWLTRQRSQYSVGDISYVNTLAIKNDVPDHNDDGDNRHDYYVNGGQWELDPVGDPALVQREAGDGYVALTGDATNLYNSDYEGVHDVKHASRSIVWLEPDHVVVYDRAATGKEGRFKRFWLQLPSAPQIDGRRATARTAGGQQLHVSSLLPDGATLAALRNTDDDEPANAERMRHRLRITDPSSPRDVRFLTVLQGADAGAGADPVRLLRGDGYDGVVIGETAVIFARDLGAPRPEIDRPDGVERVIYAGTAAK